MRRRHIVYCITAPNGLRYIGRTNGPLETRWRVHVGFATGRDAHLCPPGSLGRAIQRFGDERFKVEELASARTQLDASALERALILQVGSAWPRGMNMRVPRDQSRRPERDIIDVRRKRGASKRLAA